MTTYSFTKQGKIIYACTAIMFLAAPFIEYRGNAPLHILIIGILGFIAVLASGGFSPLKGYIILDDNGVKYFDQILWRRGVPQGGDWNEVVRAEGTYLLPWLPVFVLYFSVGGAKDRSWFVPVTFFPPDLVNDIMSRLSEDVEVKLASDFSKNYNLD